MLFGMIECSFSCPKCDSSIKLNGPVLKVHCDSCQNDIEVPESFWKDILNDIRSDLKNDLKEGEGRGSTIFGHFNTNLTYGRLKPYCYQCKKNITIDESWSLPFMYKCPDCASKIGIYESPDWLKKVVPKVKLLVNCDLTSGEEKEEHKSNKLIVFTCPKCGGALDIDGSERLINCEYCSADIYLPDDLWLRLHPVKIKKRWFIGYK